MDSNLDSELIRLPVPKVLGEVSNETRISIRATSDQSPVQIDQGVSGNAIELNRNPPTKPLGRGIKVFNVGPGATGVIARAARRWSIRTAVCIAQRIVRQTDFFYAGWTTKKWLERTHGLANNPSLIEVV